MDWQSIVQAEGPMAFTTAWRILNDVADAEDAVQEALLDAFQARRRASIGNWGGFLRLLVTRRAIDLLRKRRPTRSLVREPAACVADQPVAAAVARELAVRLRDAVALLPDREASVFSLRYFGEMTNSEIAPVLGISNDAVGVALHRARTALKHHLKLDDPAHERTASTPSDDVGSSP